MCSVRRICILEHRFDLIGDLEGCFGLGLDVLDSDAGCEFDQSQTVGEVDIKDALGKHVSIIVTRRGSCPGGKRGRGT
jgi:hypothetical protein